MSTNINHFFINLAFAQDSLPTEIQLFPAGRFSASDGRGPFELGDIAAVIKASLENGMLPIDENHASHNSVSPYSPAPAVGWMTQIYNKGGALFARVEWTKRGEQLLNDKAYRGISPTFVHDAEGKILRVLSAALTNTPALTQIKTLFSQQETHMALQVELCKLLKLDETADEAAIISAVKAKAEDVAPKADLTLLTTLAQPLGVEVKDDAKVDDVVKALQSQIVKNVETLTALQKSDTTAAREIVNLQTQISELQLANARKTAEVVIDKAIEDGKPIKAMRDHYVARHIRNAKEVEDELKAMPVMFGNQATTVTANRIVAPMVSEDASVHEIDEAAKAFIHAQAQKGIVVTHSRAVMFVTGRIDRV